MRPVNTVLLKLAKRAETYDQQHIIESFVDIGPLFTLLSNADNQILFGRRGTGKTHVLGYLANQIQRGGAIAIQLDMRTIGSTGGIYSDPTLTVAERATRLLVDTLCALHDRVLAEALANAEEYDLSLLGPLLDNFIDAATNVVVEGTVEIQESESSSITFSDSTKMDFGASLSGIQSSIGFASENKNSSEGERHTKREGTERLRVRFGPVGREFDRLVKSLPKAQLWIVLDEWSEIPLDLQPYLADLLRRTILPVRGVTVKIAAIEQRCHFRIPDPAVGHIGIEIGADAAAKPNEEMYLILEGSVRASRYGDDGSCHDLKVLRSGELFGLLSLYDKQPASASCVALEPVKAAHLPYLAYQTLIRTAAPIGHYFQLAVAHQLARDLHERSVVLRKSLKRQIELGGA